MANKKKQIIIGLRDSNFDEEDLFKSKDFKWDRKCNNTKIIVFTDQHLHEAEAIKDKNIVKIAWIVEPPSILPQIYGYIANNHQKFDFVFTYIDQLLALHNKFIFCPFAGCWIKQKDRRIYEKSKLLSTITSEKNVTIGHRIRHESIRLFSDKIDGIYGRAYQNLPAKSGKVKGLANYYYSLSIENINLNYYFTEKLIDCFACGTVPIYWGCPNIENFFDINGIITFNNLDDLKNKIENLSPEDYKRRLPSIKKNFNKVKEFANYEDILWKSGLKYIYEASIKDYFKYRNQVY